MTSRPLTAALLLTAVVGVSGCPGDDSGNDSSNDAGTTSSETTTTGEPMTAASESTTTANGDESTDSGDESTDNGDESTDNGDSTTSDGLVLGDIEVTVNYAGNLTGTLNVVAITEFPPQGPPVAIASEMNPTFPWTGTLNDLEVGEYIIFATLDVGSNNPTVPGAEDPGSGTDAMVTVDGPGPFPVEVMLTDPE